MKLLSAECQTKPWRKVNIGSDNDLVTLGNKPLSEPMLTQVDVAMWHQFSRLLIWERLQRALAHAA